MNEVLAWLRTQPGGMGTYAGFHERILASIAAEPENAAAATLLAERVSRFIDEFDRQMLPASTDKAVLDNLIGYLERAVALQDADASETLAFLNEIARIELAPEQD